MQSGLQLLNRRNIVFASAIIFFLCGFWIAGEVLPAGVDWKLTFRPAALSLISGHSPYTNPEVSAPFAGAPWGLLPLIPFALMPEQGGRGLLFGLGILVFAYTVWRLGAKMPAMVAFLVSPPVLHCLLNGNLDWLALAGVVLPPSAGLFLIAIKPQIGSMVAFFWLVEAWRSNRWRGVAKTFGPVTAAYIASFILFGFWPVNMLKETFFTQWWNASLWPASIPVGLVLVVYALRRRRMEPALAASPCLSPHVVFHSWSAAVAALVASPVETIVAVIGLWILMLVRVLSGV